MFSYAFQADYKGQKSNIISRSDNAFIPMDPANADYQQFRADWKAGATVTNADGSPAPYKDPT